MLTLIPAGFTMYSSFNAGGFFAGTPAVLAVVAGIALVLRITLAQDPFAGFGRLLAGLTVALGLYAIWTLGSAFWSDAPARAVIDFDRALLYWLLVVLLGSVAAGHGRLAVAVRATVLAMLLVCGVALASRLLPDLIDVAPAVAKRRLSFPLTYWNALGLMAAIGAVLSLYLSSSEREPAFWRACGSAALPIFATTLYFTFSRGAIVAGVAAALVYLLLAHPRSLPFALLATAAPVVVSLVVAYDADLLAGDDPTTAAAAAQGGDVAIVVAACAVAAALLRAVLAPLDRRVARISLAPEIARRARWSAGIAALAVTLSAALAFGAPERAADFVDGFSARGAPSSADNRGRLSEPGNNGRIKQWEIALDAFSEAPVLGQGAGTYGQIWALRRDRDLKVEDAHSLYIETLAELGLPGLLFIGVALACLLGGIAARARGGTRHIHAALFAAGLAWAGHAGIDWDWEMPAVTLWLFGLGAMAVAAPPHRTIAPSPERFTRVVLGAAVLGVVLLPGLMALSQRELNRAAEAFRGGDCTTAMNAALEATRSMPVRPEPFEIMGFCDIRAGRVELGGTLMRAAVRKEPRRWQAHYGLALALAMAGEDPRPAARRTLQLNPRGDLARDLARRFRTDDPQKWRRRAATARLPVL